MCLFVERMKIMKNYIGIITVKTAMVNVRTIITHNAKVSSLGWEQRLNSVKCGREVDEYVKV